MPTAVDLADDRLFERQAPQGVMLVDHKGRTTCLSAARNSDSLVHPRRRGVTIAEVMVIVGVLIVLFAIVLPTLASRSRNSVQANDGVQLRHIHSAWITWSRSLEGLYPIPGLIDRSGDVPGQGAEDLSQNSHANLYSACIAANYFSPKLCVSPAEASARVAAHVTYNFSAYNAMKGVYWDSSFQADLGTASHLSYGTSLLDGGRKLHEWRESKNPQFVVSGNRGVEGGGEDRDRYTRSTTLAIHGPTTSWEGNVCFNDNHIEYIASFTPERAQRLGEHPNKIADNIFVEESVGGTNDIFLAVCPKVTLVGEKLRSHLSWD